MLDQLSLQDPLRVIVADDNDLVRDVVRDLIEHGLSANCTTAHSLDSAIEVASFARFDLALLDYNMPGMDGLAGVDRILKCNVVNVALFSGQISSDVIDDAIELGVSGFLPKTLDPHVITEAVRAMCDGQKFPAQYFLDQMIQSNR